MKTFRGQNVYLAEISITGSAGIAITAHFADDEGIVHALVKHRYAPNTEGSSPVVDQAVRSLLEALTKWVESKHFTGVAASTDVEEISRGIAESLAPRASSVDDPGTQG